MSVFGMFRGWVLRGLTRRSAGWAAAGVLAAALVAGFAGQASADSSLSVTGVGSASPVLRQAGSVWKTTVLLSGASCAQASSTVSYRLAVAPDGGLSGTGAAGLAGKAVGTSPDGSACAVTVRFTGLTPVPVTAALVVSLAGTSASVALTVSRGVTLASYLAVPAAAGGIAVALYLLLLLAVSTCDWQGKRHHLFSGDWWKHPIAGSGTWSAGDSWATNITTGLVVVSTFLAATTASSSLFPGVALDRFAIVNILAGIFVVAAPVLFGILYTFFTGRNPGPSADSAVYVPGGGRVLLRVPSGAVVAPTGQMNVSGNPDGTSTPNPSSGTSYQIAPGSLLLVSRPAPTGTSASPAGTVVAFSGTSDIGVLPGAVVDIVPEPADEWYPGTVSAGDPPFRLSPADGAKLTVTGTADVHLPAQAVITGPRRRRSKARAVPAGGRWLLLPQGSTVIVGSLGVMVATNVLTMFGIGAELGIAFALARLSDASGGWSTGIYAGLAALGAFLLTYAITATQAMANPQPGSSLSAQAGTSFTL
jgi:hypothetical protein